LWREIQAQGFTGTRSLVAKWIHAHGQPSPVAPAPAPPQLPAARELAWLLCKDADQQTAEDHLLIARLRQHPELVHVQELIQQGAAMIRQHQVDALAPWLKACSASPVGELRNFADVLQRDAAAVKAALTLPWSSGPVEGHINRLKLIKSRALKVRGGIISQANKYLGSFCSSQRIFPPQIIQVLLKRSGYGRMQLNLLRQRVLYDAA
jgi:transposase